VTHLYLYLKISQLASYGFANLAKAVAEHTNTEASAVLDPSNLLVEYCYKGMKCKLFVIYFILV
jgi:hypothetical protein